MYVKFPKDFRIDSVNVGIACGRFPGRGFPVGYGGAELNYAMVPDLSDYYYPQVISKIYQY